MAHFLWRTTKAQKSASTQSKMYHSVSAPPSGSRRCWCCLLFPAVWKGWGQNETASWSHDGVITDNGKDLQGDGQVLSEQVHEKVPQVFSLRTKTSSNLHWRSFELLLRATEPFSSLCCWEGKDGRQKYNNKTSERRSVQTSDVAKTLHKHGALETNALIGAKKNASAQGKGSEGAETQDDCRHQESGSGSCTRKAC